MNRTPFAVLQHRYCYYALLVFIAAQAGLWWGMHTASGVREETQTIIAAAEEQISQTDLLTLIRPDGPLQVWLGCVALGGLVMLLAGVAMNLLRLWRWWQRRGAANLRFAALPSATTAAPWCPPRSPARLWSLTDLWRLSILIITCAMVAPLAQLMPMVLHPQHALDPIATALWATTVLDLLAVAVMAAYARSKGMTLRTLVGSSTCSMTRLIGIGIRGYVALLPLLVVTLLVIGWIVEYFGWAPPSHPLSAFFLEEVRWSWLVYGLLFTALAGPLVEELVFRGVVFHALRHRWGFRAGLVVSSALFALLHANWAGFLPIFLLGALLADLYESTGSLIPSMAAHMVHNTGMVILVMTVRAVIGLQGSVG